MKARSRAKTLLLLGIFLLGFTLPSWAQKVTLDFNKTKIEKILSSIKAQTGMGLVFSDQLLDVNRVVSIHVKDADLGNALTDLLEGTKVTFEIRNNKIYFIEKKAEQAPRSDKKKKVTGVVRDPMGEPVIGANVIEKGSAGNGVITDLDGQFALEVTDNASLAISYIGYLAQDVSTKGRSTLNIVLKEDAQTLEEVVVVGYGVQKKVNMTGAVAQVDSKMLENRPIQNVSSGLQGLMPGITITSGEGRPGQDGGTIRVRGVGTMNSADPYILVDGVETGTMNSVDPNDIESISVLKDAASAAIYGSKASNGVILITTKRGQTGKPRITYSGYASLQNPTVLRDLMSSYDYARLYDKSRVEAGLEPRFDTVGDGAVYQKFKDGSDPYNYPNTDWYDLVFQTGFQHSHNVNVSGGTDNVRYMASAGYLHQTGTLPNSERQQFNGRTNLDIKMNSRMNVRVNMAYVNNDYSDPNTSYAGGSSYQIMALAGKMAPWIVGRYEDGTYGTVSDGNPLAWLDANQTVRRENQNFSGTLSADYKLFDGLTATLTGAYVNNQQHYKAFQKFIQYNPNKKSDPNKLNENYSGWHRATFDALLNYDKQLGLHGLKGMAGWHTEKYSYAENKMERKNFPNNDLTDMNAGDVASSKNEGYTRELAMISWFGRINYDYAGKYLFEANIRADASSRFADGNRWGYFPSFSAAWRISEEAFMEKTKDWLSNLKLRASYGNLGNQAALNDFYPWMNNYALDTKYPFGDNLQSGYYQKNYKISTISWEKARTWGVGFDATILNKLTVGFDYYDRKTTGIIMDVPVSAEFGLGAYKDNVGAMVNRGMELTISYNDKWGDWSFGATANLAYNKNKILDLNGVSELVDPDNEMKTKKVGDAINSFYLYKTEGFFNSDEEAAAWTAKYAKEGTGYPFGIGDKAKKFKAGDLIYQDTNGDGMLNEEDRVLAGSSDPSYTFGLSLSAGFKNFDLSMMFTGVADVKRMLDRFGFNGEFAGDNSHPDAVWLDSWTPDHKNAKMPRIAYNSGSYNMTKLSTFWLQDGSYVRLKNLQFGYTIPKSALKSVGIENIRVYYSGENILTFHKMIVNADPELGDINSFPINRSHSIGVNVTF